MRAAFLRDGFVVISGLLDPVDLQPAIETIATRLPTGSQFHGEPTAQRWAHLRDDPYAAMTDAPFWGGSIFNLATHPKLIDLAVALLDTDDLRLYALELWSKYGGGADYAQSHHRDHHSPLVPTSDVRFRQVEMFVLLTDCDANDGPIAIVPNPVSDHLPRQRHQWHIENEPALYGAEQLGTGPAGTVIAFRSDTVHRATAMTRSTGWRLSLSANYRRADDEWLSRTAWGDHSFTDAWTEFATTATYRQLLLFGFPPAAHPYWTAETLAGVATRYPGIDLSAWMP